MKIVNAEDARLFGPVNGETDPAGTADSIYVGTGKHQKRAVAVDAEKEGKFKGRLGHSAPCGGKPVHLGDRRMNTTLLALFLLPLAAACSSGPIAKAALDDEVRRLCAIDGGVKVYETVKLPADKFDRYGKPNFRIPSKEYLRPQDEYFYILDIFYYRKGNPEISREHTKLFRRSDGKLLGEPAPEIWTIG